jgi:hypothetical protein
VARNKGPDKTGGLSAEPLASPIGFLNDPPNLTPATKGTSWAKTVKPRTPSPVGGRRLARLNETRLLAGIVGKEVWEGTFGRGLRRRDSLLFVDTFMTERGHTAIEWRHEYRLDADQRQHPALGDNDDALSEYAASVLAALKLPRPGRPGYFWETRQGQLRWSTNPNSPPKHVDRKDQFQGLLGDRVDDEIAEKFLEDQLALIQMQAEAEAEAIEEEDVEAERKRRAVEATQLANARVWQAYEAIYASEWLAIRAQRANLVTELIGRWAGTIGTVVACSPANGLWSGRGEYTEAAINVGARFGAQLGALKAEWRLLILHGPLIFAQHRRLLTEPEEGIHKLNEKKQEFAAIWKPRLREMIRGSNAKPSVLARLYRKQLMKEFQGLSLKEDTVADEIRRARKKCSDHG